MEDLEESFNSLNLVPKSEDILNSKYPPKIENDLNSKYSLLIISFFKIDLLILSDRDYETDP
jgi:hypothetical protein